MSAGIISGNIKAISVHQLSIDLANNATVTTAVTSVTVPGVQLGDFVHVNKPSHTTGIGIANVRVSAADTIEITTVNPTAGGVNPAAETFTILVIKPETVIGSVAQ